MITVQNGVDVVDTASRHVGREHVAGGCAYIMAAVEAPGRIRHTANDSLMFGERDGSRAPHGRDPRQPGVDGVPTPIHQFISTVLEPFVAGRC